MRRTLRSEEGASLILLAIMATAVFAFAALTVDIGIMLLARTQLQNAADSAALAGASVLAQTAGDQIEAKEVALRFASEHRAFGRGSGGIANRMTAVAMDAGDVTFPQPTSIHVIAERSSARGNAMRSYFMKVLDPKRDPAIEMSASATASALDACGTGCVKPWCPPDRWVDANKNNKYDPNPTSNKGEYYDSYATGYNSPGDVGVQVVLKYRSGSSTMVPSYFYAVDLPPVSKGTPTTGANAYRDWIAGCPDPSFLVEPNDLLQIEPGNMAGPTRQGVQALIALDPKAKWDVSSKRVIGSAYSRSPRIVPVPLFDPSIGVLTHTGGRKKVKVVKVAMFFIESVNSSGNVTGRFVRISAADSATPCARQGGQGFLYQVKLTE